MTVQHIQSTTLAEYYRVNVDAEAPVMVRRSNRHQVPALCLRCRSFECDHAVGVEDAVNAGALVAA